MVEQPYFLEKVDENEESEDAKDEEEKQQSSKKRKNDDSSDDEFNMERYFNKPAENQVQHFEP